MPDFFAWIEFLESLGYHSFYQDLNAKDYGIPQSRNRCFMFSFLEDVTYEFPEPSPLKKLLADILERNVDEKYYIKTEKAEKLIKDLIARNILPSCCNSLNEEERDTPTNLDTYPDNKEDSVIANPQIKQIGNLVERENYANPQVGRVYAGNGVAPTLSTMQGGTDSQK